MGLIYTQKKPLCVVRYDRIDFFVPTVRTFSEDFAARIIDAQEAHFVHDLVIGATIEYVGVAVFFAVFPQVNLACILRRNRLAICSQNVFGEVSSARSPGIHCGRRRKDFGKRYDPHAVLGQYSTCDVEFDFHLFRFSGLSRFCGLLGSGLVGGLFEAGRLFG